MFSIAWVCYGENNVEYQNSDNTPPEIVSSIPSDGATGVSPVQNIVIKFSESLDRSSINSSTVVLEYSTGKKGIITYDESTQTITFSPLKPLQPGTSYILRLSDIKDKSGNMISDKSITFTICKNLETKYISYKSGEVVNYSFSKYDNRGNLEKFTYYKGSGKDKIWFTSDDTLDYYHIYEHNDDGYITEQSEYIGPGNDGKWFTADDSLGVYTVTDYDENGNITKQIKYKGPGEDGIWFNEDDSLLYCVVSTYNSRGNQTKYILYNGVGKDGVLFTSDDSINYYTIYSYDPHGMILMYVHYNGPGLDKLWFTADDSIYSYTSHIYDTDGNLIKVTEYAGPGKDETWFTDDDEKSLVREFSTGL